jgi:hypothetical protein
MIELDDSYFIAKGNNRSCFRHPLDPAKCIKVDTLKKMGPTEKEARYYQTLARIRPDLDYSYVPRFYGFVETNLGRGGVFDLIMDEGSLEVSKTFEFYLKDGRVAADDPLWIEAHRRILEGLFRDSIIIRDLHVRNFCARKMLDGSIRLVAIDGIGHRDFIPLCNYSRWAANRKLRRQIARKDFHSLDAIIHRFNLPRELRRLGGKKRTA